MMFQSPTVNGITGWMLRTLATSSSGPTPNRVLFWNGRLIIAATGFCAALARSAWFLCERRRCERQQRRREQPESRSSSRKSLSLAEPGQVPDEGTCHSASVSWSRSA